MKASSLCVCADAGREGHARMNGVPCGRPAHDASGGSDRAEAGDRRRGRGVSPCCAGGA